VEIGEAAAPHDAAVLAATATSPQDAAVRAMIATGSHRAGVAAGRLFAILSAENRHDLARFTSLVTQLISSNSSR
jgi:hypothetical protein